MDPSSEQHHHHQEMSSQTLESMLCTKPNQEMKKPRPQDEVAPSCPRCDSTNTKFCYYNNYSLSQPRYFCKSCRRYWTKGGTLRNVPVGGGCRKNKRSSSKRSTQDHSLTTNPNQLSPLTQFSYDSNELSLAFARLQNQESGQLGLGDRDISRMYPELQRTIRTEAIFVENSTAHSNHFLGSRDMCTPSAETIPTGFLDALRGGFLEIPNSTNFHHNMYYGIGNNYGNMGHASEEMATHFDQEMSSGIVKEEMCSIAREGENRTLWGFPWKNINGENGNISDFESSKQNWNGVGVPSWHGLLNSPLM